MTQTWSKANLVVYCGIIVEVRIALRVTFVCSAVYTTFEKTGYMNDKHTIRAIKTHLFHLMYLFCTYMGVKYVS